MSSPDASLVPRHYRAPRENHAALIDPRWAEIDGWLTGHATSAPLAELPEELLKWRAAARRELRELARGYTSQYRDVAAVSSTDASALADSPIILSGHQPQLFHPGVWFKNFVLSTLAQRHQAIGINLIIDNDMARSMSIRVPGGTAAEPHVVGVAYDQATVEMPHEERRLVDRGLFASFPERVTAELAPLIAEPLVREWWPEVVRQSQRTDNLGQALSAARHQLEREWGLETWELPLSLLCETRVFRSFTLRLLADPARLHSAYHGALATYRQLYRLRSHAHPVPDLSVDGDWYEAPFWLWSERDPRRRRLFVRRTKTGLECTDRAQLACQLTVDECGNWDDGVDQLLEWSRGGVRLRPRALLTTLYARLLLADLFLHGIGGGMYDQVTDQFCRRLWGTLPVPFATLTATCRLPIAHEVATEEDVRMLDQRLRDAWFHPDRYVTGMGGAVQELVERKRDLVDMQLPRGTRLARHRGIASVNEQLRERLVELRERWLAERARLVAAARRHSLLASREYAFCLHPVDELRRVLLELSSAAL